MTAGASRAGDMTNEELLKQFQKSVERFWCGKERDLDRLLDEQRPLRAAVLERMVEPSPTTPEPDHG